MFKYEDVPADPGLPQSSAYLFDMVKQEFKHKKDLSLIQTVEK